MARAKKGLAVPLALDDSAMIRPEAWKQDLGAE